MLLCSHNSYSRLVIVPHLNGPSSQNSPFNHFSIHCLVTLRMSSRSFLLRAHGNHIFYYLVYVKLSIIVFILEFVVGMLYILWVTFSLWCPYRHWLLCSIVALNVVRKKFKISLRISYTIEDLLLWLRSPYKCIFYLKIPITLKRYILMYLYVFPRTACFFFQVFI